MLIIPEAYGGLGNRLQTYCHSLAFAMEHDLSIIHLASILLHHYSMEPRANPIDRRVGTWVTLAFVHILVVRLA